MTLTDEENVEISALLLVLAKTTPNKAIRDSATKMAERLKELFVSKT